MAANKSRPLDCIKQTSKTILFEKFNSSANDLYTILRNEDIREKDEFFETVEKELEVRSFEEFVDKFMPTVWEWTEATGDPEMPVNFHYSMEEPDGIPNASPMRLDKNEFYSMVMNLYEQKGSSGESNLKFEYSDVEELLSPKKILESAKQLRKDLEYNYTKMLSLGEGSKHEKNKCIMQINSIRREIVSQYKDSLTGVIKLALADTQQKLMLLEDNKGDDKKQREPDEKPKLLCNFGFKDDGSLDIRPIEMQDNNTPLIETVENNSKLIELVEKDYDQYGNNRGLFVKNVISSTYCNKDLGNIKEIDKEKLIQQRNTYAALYKNSQEQFIRVISSAIEKMLNVKTFFEHAAGSEKKKLHSSLIVSNCFTANLLGEDVKEDFTYFLKEASRESTEKMWFAIVPAIGDEEFMDNLDYEADLNDIRMNDYDEENIIKDIKNVKTFDGEELTSLSALKQMLGIMKNAGIVTFFNFKANEKTGFSKFNKDIIEMYRSKLESVNGNSYAVFTYPNFTVLPKKETYIPVVETKCGSDKKNVYIDIPGIYIDSSYVAAGLVVASQTPDCLIEKYSRSCVNTGYPCVRYDFERMNNRFIMMTKMNREGKDFLSDAEEDICKDKFGFCFCGNYKKYNNQPVNNSYVFTARNMNKDDDGQYEPIYKRLTMDFVKQYLRFNFPSASGNSISRQDVESFIKNDVSQWIRDASSANYENNILRSSGDETENITIDNDSNKLKIKFLDKENVMDIDITKE